MTAKLLSGKEVSESMLAQILKDSNELIAKGIQPTLAIMRVGDDPGSISYEKSIITRMGKSNIKVESVTFPIDVTNADFIAKLKSINDDKKINAILIFKPLPGTVGRRRNQIRHQPGKRPRCDEPDEPRKLMIADEKDSSPARRKALW
jgi:methylenetetrahydrofolate dehydrogenase (NADP+)/methenyltetrahydrofolate cyclohydrolase